MDLDIHRGRLAWSSTTSRGLGFHGDVGLWHEGDQLELVFGAGLVRELARAGLALPLTRSGTARIQMGAFIRAQQQGGADLARLDHARVAESPAGRSSIARRSAHRNRRAAAP